MAAKQTRLEKKSQPSPRSSHDSNATSATQNLELDKLSSSGETLTGSEDDDGSASPNPSGHHSQPEQSSTPHSNSHLLRSFAALKRSIKAIKFSKVGLWLGIAVGVAALIVAVYYGFWSYRMQQWQAQKEFRDWCADSKAAHITSPRCNMILETEPIPPPFIRRQEEDVLDPPPDDLDHEEVLKGDTSLDDLNLVHHWFPGFSGIGGFPTAIPTVGGNWNTPLGPSLWLETLTWLLQTTIIAASVFFLTIILTAFVVRISNIDAAHSQYSLTASDILQRNRSGFWCLFGTAFGLVFLGNTSGNATNFGYHVMTGSVVHIAVAALASDVKLVALVLSFTAVVWFARKTSLRRTPRYIGEMERKTGSEFEARTEAAWIRFHRTAQQPYTTIEASGSEFRRELGVDDVVRERKNALGGVPNICKKSAG